MIVTFDKILLNPSKNKNQMIFYHFYCPSYFFWQVKKASLQYTMSCKKHSALWILWKEVNDMLYDLMSSLEALFHEVFDD